MNNTNYDSAPGIRRSDLFKLATTPLHYKYAMDHKDEAETTSALLFGSAAHKYVLEIESFGSEFAIAPRCDRRTKEGKQIALDFEAKCENEGLTAISSDDFGTICDMAAAIDENKIARALLTGETEKPFFWTDEATGIYCKCKPDCITWYEGKKYIVDYKTTDSCADGHFEASCRKYGYKLQAGMYWEGVFDNTLQDMGFAFVAQEKKPPYAVRVYFCTPEYVKEGRDQFHELLSTLKYCQENNDWYGYEGPMHEATDLYGEDERNE